jgi:hypothetical protein
MDGFQVNQQPTEDFHFWIKGHYNATIDQFLFLVYVNPKLTGTRVGEIFREFKERLEKNRTLKETETMINEMLDHTNERMQELGQIVAIAADKAWAEHFIDSSISE